jgi:hypothetical protein
MQPAAWRHQKATRCAEDRVSSGCASSLPGSHRPIRKVVHFVSGPFPRRWHCPRLLPAASRTARLGPHRPSDVHPDAADGHHHLRVGTISSTPRVALPAHGFAPQHRVLLHLDLVEIINSLDAPNVNGCSQRERAAACRRSTAAPEMEGAPDLGSATKRWLSDATLPRHGKHLPNKMMAFPLSPS